MQTVSLDDSLWCGQQRAPTQIETAPASLGDTNSRDHGRISSPVTHQRILRSESLNAFQSVFCCYPQTTKIRR